LASGDTVTISWSVSPNEGWINTTTGEVTRPTHTQGNKEVTLTATFSKEGGVDQIKTFTMTIVKAPITSDEEIGEEINILTWDSIKGNNTTKDNVTTNLVSPLPTLASGDTVTISWSISPNDGWIDTTTGEVTRPTYRQGNKEVTLTATFSKEGGVDQIKTFLLTIKARGRSTGGNSSSNNDSEVTQNNTNNNEASKISINGIAYSIISDAILESTFNQTVANSSGEKTANIVIPGVKDETSYELTLPIKTLTLADSSRQIEIKTDIATITLPSNMLISENNPGAKDVSLTIESADKTKLSAALLTQIGNHPIVELELRIEGQVVAWNNENAPVTVSILYEPTEAEKADPEHIAVWYIDGAGNVVSVPSGKYDPATGRVTFTTTHFSAYAIVYLKKSYTDLDKVDWAKKQIEVLTSKGIMSGRTETEFAPIAGITRAEYVSALVRTLNLSAKFDVNFSDVKLGDLYYNEIGTAKVLGITSGVGNNNFKQDATITRQEMLVMTERALRSLKRISKTGTMEDLEKFIDREELAIYSVNSISALVKEGLIKGDGSKLNGSADTTKAEAAVFLYRIYNN
jgi:lactocepin